MAKSWTIKEFRNFINEIIEKDDLKFYNPGLENVNQFCAQIDNCVNIDEIEDQKSIKNEKICDRWWITSFDDQNDDNNNTKIIYSFLLSEFSEEKPSNSDQVKKVVEKLEDFKNEGKNLKITFIINKITEKQAKSEIDKIKKISSDSKLDISFVQFDDISHKYRNIKEDERDVSEYTFNVLKNDNGNNNYLMNPPGSPYESIVINLSAKDINNLYEEFGCDCGPLYAANLRYHIVEKKSRWSN